MVAPDLGAHAVEPCWVPAVRSPCVAAFPSYRPTAPVAESEIDVAALGSPDSAPVSAGRPHMLVRRDFDSSLAWPFAAASAPSVVAEGSTAAAVALLGSGGYQRSFSVAFGSELHTLAVKIVSP